MSGNNNLHSRREGERQIAGFEEKTQLRLRAMVSRTPITFVACTYFDIYVSVARVVYPSAGPSRSLSLIARFYSTLVRIRSYDVVTALSSRWRNEKMCGTKIVRKGMWTPCKCPTIIEKYRSSFPDRCSSARGLLGLFATFKLLLRNTRYAASRKIRSCI